MADVKVLHYDLYKQSSYMNTTASQISTFSFLVKTNFRRRETEKYINQWYSLFGQLGGVISFLSMIKVIIFGSSRVSPWGLFQNSLWHVSRFNSTYIQGHEPPLSRKEVSPANPDQPIGPEETTRIVLKVQEQQRLLEQLLSEYYLDTSFIEKVKAKARKVESEKVPGQGP
jgi:hypothetical protein